MTIPQSIKTGKTVIRPLRREEAAVVLPEMLYQALFRLPGEPPAKREIVFGPKLNMYIDGFGREHDHCLVAEISGVIAGAVWTRLLGGGNKGYGYVDGETPELAIALLPEYRGREIGTRLMEKMLSLLTEHGYRQVSLSVHKANAAARLYRKLGARAVRETTEDCVMVFKLDT